MSKVSIIVPVYNNEKFLDQCIQSVLTQTYTNWELLLIDDGSTDSSGTICDKYVALDDRIQTIHKENTGVSDSKNIALDIAQGEYVMFLDSDDYWCDNTCVERLVGTSRKYNADIVRGEYKAVDDCGVFLFERELNEINLASINRILSPYQFLRNAIQGEFFLVLSLFKIKVVKAIRFSDRIFLEDVEYYMRCLTSFDAVCVYIPLCFYAYRKHAASVSHKRNLRKLRDSFSLSYFYNDCVSTIMNADLKEFCRNESIMLYFHTMGTVASFPHFSERNRIIKELDLVQVQKDVVTWILESRKKYRSPVFYISPLWGVWYMFVRNLILDTVYYLRKCLKLT